jgi:hypothetical protein
MMGFHTMLLAFVTDLLSVNRRLLEELQAYHRERASRDGSAWQGAAGPTRELAPRGTSAPPESEPETLAVRKAP